MIDTSCFRPKDASSDAARQATLLAGNALVEAKQALLAAREARDAQLLDGTLKVREKAQAELTAANDQVDVLEAVIAQLKVRVEAAAREEAVGSVTSRLHEIAAATQKANDFAQAKGALLIDLLRESTAIAGELDTSRALLRMARSRAYQHYVDDPRIAAGADVNCSLSSAVEAWSRAVRDARAPE